MNYLRTALSVALLSLTTFSLWSICPSAVCSATAGSVCNWPCRTLKRYPIRPQGRSKDRQLVGTARYVHDDDEMPLKFCLTATLEYARSFKSGQILDALFGPDISPAIDATPTTCDGRCGRTIQIQGSQLGANRTPQAWLADYFYLPRDFDATVAFNPRITNIIADFDLYVHLNPCMKGWYARLYVPMVHAQWDLNMCESVSKNIDESGDEVGNYPKGYFATCNIPKNKLVQTFTAYAAGAVPADDYQVGQEIIPLQTPPDYEDPDHHITFQPLSAARMSPFVCRKSGFADIRWEWGWNILTCNDHHFGLNIQGAVPSGKRPNPVVLFDPIIGNGRHWELGSGLTAHYVLWKNEEESCHLAGHLDVNLTYILPAREMRTFDLRNKPNSAYMLAACYRANDGVAPFETLYVNGTGSDCGNTPSHIFALEYAPVANLTTLSVRVNNDLHADLVAMLSLYTPRFTIDVGYNFWARTVENIDFTDAYGVCTQHVNSLCKPGTTRSTMWALKGDARIFGYTADVVRELEAGTPQALSATESKADIHNGTNQVPLDFSSNDLNNTIDNTAPANICADGPTPVDLLNQPDSAVTDPIQTSYKPVFLSYDQLDIVTPRQMSHKLFAHLSYSCDHERWAPFLGVGGFVEMGRNSDCRSCPNCPYNLMSRIDVALSQWAVWFKVGLAFEDTNASSRKAS